MRIPEQHSAERVRRYCCFGDFTLDVEHRLLRRGGEEVTLRPKSFEVLAHLVDHPGQLVIKAALIEALWPETAVTDNSLAQCMVEIRRALADDSQQLIRTVARHGYLFAAPVSTPVVEFAVQATGADTGPGPLAVAPGTARGRPLMRAES